MNQPALVSLVEAGRVESASIRLEGLAATYVV